MNYIDSHAHLFSEDGYPIEEILKNINDVGLKYVMSVCCDLESYYKTLEYFEDDKRFDIAIGIHPTDVKDSTIEQLDEIYKLAKHSKVKAIGEIGLDYHWDPDNKDKQKEFFIAQIEMANKLDLPIVIHSRDAIEDTYNILKEYPVNRKGVLHCYSSSAQMAERFIKLGYYISLGGPVTFKNAKAAKEVAQTVDINYLLSETDSPFLTPTPYRGKINQPSYVIYNYQEIAALRNMNIEELVNAMVVNYLRLFHNEN